MAAFGDILMEILKGRFNKNIPNHFAINNIKEIIEICTISDNFDKIDALLKNSLFDLHKFELDMAFRPLDENNLLNNEQKHWEMAHEFWSNCCDFGYKCSVSVKKFIKSYKTFFLSMIQDDAIIDRYIGLLKYLLKLRNEDQISCKKFGDFIATLGPIVDNTGSHLSFVKRVCKFLVFVSSTYLFIMIRFLNYVKLVIFFFLLLI